MNSKKAFTLVEILVVLSIIAIIGSVAIARMRGAITSASDTEKKVNVSTIKKALFLYGTQHLNTYPIETGCNIGSCTNLDVALRNFLPSEIGGTYRYVSAGTEFTISVVLSSGKTYTYDSSNDSSMEAP